jgi:hypothetical protein
LLEIGLARLSPWAIRVTAPAPDETRRVDGQHSLRIQLLVAALFG